MDYQPVFDRAPRRIYWELTRACDLACRHCRAEAMAQACPTELTPDESAALLDRLAAFGSPLPHVVFTGGDPLKRPDLWSLIARAQSLGMGVSVAPSGTPLLTPDVIARLKAADVEAISLSFDGPDAARHDALRQVPGCFDRTVAAAHQAAAVGLPFQINTLVCTETVDDLPAIYDLACALRAARWSLFFLVTVGRGTALEPIDAARCERLLADLARAARPGGPVVTTTEAPHFRRVLATIRPSRDAPPTGGHPGMRAGHAAGIRDGNGIMFISDVGDVRPSGFLEVTVGNVRRDDPVAIYRDAPLFRALREADAFGGRCGVCEYRAPCGGSRARAWAATGDPLAEDPLCAYVPGAA